MARPKRQEARRLQLVDAALAQTAASGLRELTLTEVADRAQVSRGSLLYYFDGLDALLVEVHRRAAHRFAAEREAEADRHADPVAALVAVMVRGLPRTPDDELVRALYEFDALTGRHPVHDALSEALYTRQVALYRRLLDVGDAQGAFRRLVPRDALARVLVAVEDAHGLRILGASPTVTYRVAVEDLAAVAGQATGVDLVSRLPTEA